MSGDVTIQALERLSHMPDRDVSDNGLVIAAQKYYDVYFTGGSINGIDIGTINPGLGVFTNLTVQGTIDAADLNISGQSQFDGNAQIDGELVVLTAIYTTETNTESLRIDTANRGTFTANSTTPVVVPKTSVTANSVIIPTCKTVGGTQGQTVKITPTAGVGFTAVAESGDTSVYNYTIIN